MRKFYFLLISSLVSTLLCQVASADTEAAPIALPDNGKILSTTTAPAPLTTQDGSALPDIPEPARFDSSLTGQPDGSLQLKANIDGDQFSIKPVFSTTRGVPVDAGIVSQKIPATTVGWMLSSRPDKTETVMNMAWRTGGNQQLLFTAAQLHGMVDVEVDGKTNLNQTSSGLNYRYFIDRPWLTGLELSGYTSEGQGLYSSGENLPHVAASSLVGLRMGLEASPIPDAKLKIGIGSERWSYDGLAGAESLQNLNTSIRWSQILMPTVKYNAILAGKGAERTVATGLDINLYNGQQLGVKLAHTQWNDGQSPDNVVQLTYNLQFGKKFVPFQFKGDNTPWNSSVSNEVLQRPGYLPKSILSSPN